MSLLVPQDLKSNSNAVVRYNKERIEINGIDEMVVYTKRIVTVFNKYGNRHANTVEFYNDYTEIKKIEAKIYDQFGDEIKKIRRNDFTDQSAVSGGTLYSDSRVKFFEYTPVKYPYTIEYESEVHHESTAFMPQWRPIDGFFLAVQHSEFEIQNNTGETIRLKKENFENDSISEISEFHFKAENLPSIKYEAYCPNIAMYTPRVKVVMAKFSMAGVEGHNNNWQDFGKWVYSKLLTGTDVLPQSAIEDVKALTDGVDNKIERAKLVYKYMQDKTRYISVQIGIGGWKPMLADDVDKLGYGDCKGLTNYTKALLEVVDVPSYYTLVYGDENIRDIDADFSSVQGNHAILCVPNNDEHIFLECTSQSNPFGFTAGFTDDRDVLLVKPEGGEIVHTKVYNADDSVQKTMANVIFDEVGSFTSDVTITTTGYQYNNHQRIETETLRDQQLYYKNYWDNINNITIDNIEIEDDKDNIVFSENIKVVAENYASKSGKRLILQPNMFNKLSNIPPRYSERKLDFKVNRSFKDVDEYIIQLPENMNIEAMSEGKEIKTKFGIYKFSIEALEGNKLKYTRTYVLNKGNYEKEDYKAYRNFRKQIVKNDKSKIVLITS
ncbi:DUF3857 domain-containing protein [Winogradskyella sp.]|uniref:DUF3857 domain-containing protein n=1 Tax=Winogradskyella sp. TaxID=1883156 RepID=UPI003F6AF557